MPIIQALPLYWVPDVVVLDAMFLIQCNPLRQTMTITDYAKLMFVMPHYQDERHFNPKLYEQNRRDSTCDNNNHEHIQFQPSTKVPKAFIVCRECKRRIIQAIGLFHIYKMPDLIYNMINA